MASKIIKTSARHVTPVFSVNKDEAKKRVLNLYRTWYRQVPSILLNYDVNVTVKDYRKKLHEEFSKNKDISDIRVIDMMVIKAQMEFEETVKVWKTKNHIMDFMCKKEDNQEKDFLTKFYDGHE